MIIRNLAFAVAIFCAAPLAVVAQSSTVAEVLDSVLRTALDEQRIIHTCGATIDPRSVTLLAEVWEEDAAEAIVMLKDLNFESPTFTELQANATAEAIRMPDDTPFGTVIAYCAANPEWMRNMSTLNFVSLRNAIPNTLRGLQ